MQIRNNKGDLTAKITYRLMRNGECVTTETLYEGSKRVSQIITMPDKQGKARTMNAIFKQKHMIEES